MQLNRSASIDTLVRDIYEEFRFYLSEGKGFAPVLFMHRFEGENEPTLLELITLEQQDQEDWPDFIADAVDRTDAALWALATQVLIRRTSRRSANHTEELLFVFVVADAQQPEGARIWSTPFCKEGETPQPFVERTDDPNLQMMVSQLTGRRFLH